MPADFVIDVKLGVVFSKASGVLRHDEAWHHQARLVAHPDFRPHFSQLLDAREVVKVELTVEDLAQLTAPTVFDLTSRRVILVSSDLQYGISRMYETFSELKGETGFRIFRDAREAFAFLGIEGVPPADAYTHLVSFRYS